MPRRRRPSDTPLLDGAEVPVVKRMNKLLYGDNLTVMGSMAKHSVDLIYLDPPFNSQRTYNLIYTKLTGLPLPEQEEAFCDAWQMDDEKEEMAKHMHATLGEYGVTPDVIILWQAWIRALRHTQPRLLAYLLYMTPRLFQMKEILKPTGTIYLQCDPAASHYIKVMMDAAFGHTNFRNEIIWKRTSAHSSAHGYGPVHDTILVYSVSDEFTWNVQYTAHDPEYIKDFYRHEDKRGIFRLSDLTADGIRDGSSGEPWRGVDPTKIGRHWAAPRAAAKNIEGWDDFTTQQKLDALDKAGRIHWPKKEGGVPSYRRYLEEMPGVPLQDIWTDIPPIGARAAERLGYPTQKPIALLERIIKASSNPGDTIFDPFCGCGTAVYAAHLNQRHWIGCDIAILSVRIVRDVLAKRYGLVEAEHYQIAGVPLSVDSATDLFQRDPRQFQHWLVELAGGFCNTKHSGDLGIDGSLYFDTGDGLKSMVISVKGGHVGPAYVRELRGVLERDGTEMAAFLCLNEPTKGMKEEAAKAGVFEYQGVRYPRLQIRTVKELLAGYAIQSPSRVQTLSWEGQTKLAL
jgi:DNA modification methylase